MSIGEEITQATLIARATVVTVQPPYWNSPTGNEWSAEYDANPNAYVTLPIPVTPVVFRIEHIFHQGASFDADTPVPQVTENSAIVVAFTGIEPELPAASELVLFLRWQSLYLSNGHTRSVWHTDLGPGIWQMYGDDAMSPTEPFQLFSLLTGGAKGDVNLVVVDGEPISQLTVAEFERLIDVELTEPGVLASFESWPWEPAYQEIAAESDLPDEESTPAP
jgi:hypothetical protein